MALSEIDGGKFHGNGREVGAARYYTCDDDYIMVGKSHIFCGKDLEWAPAIPRCVPAVTCYGQADNAISEVFADGKAVSIGTSILLFV